MRLNLAGAAQTRAVNGPHRAPNARRAATTDGTAAGVPNVRRAAMIERNAPTGRPGVTNGEIARSGPTDRPDQTSGETAPNAPTDRPDQTSGETAPNGVGRIAETRLVLGTSSAAGTVPLRRRRPRTTPRNQALRARSGVRTTVGGIVPAADATGAAIDGLKELPGRVPGHRLPAPTSP